MALSLGVTFLALEGAVRMWPESATRYPLLEGRQFKGPFNSLGYRDTEHAPTPEPGTHRVLFVGDSFTFAGGVLLDDGYPKRVERRLQRFRKEPWESVVLAKPGLNTTDELSILETEGLSLQPEVVVLGYVLNDAESPDWAEHRRAREWQEMAGLTPPWWSASALFRMVGRRLRSAREARLRIRNYRELFANGSTGFAESMRALARMAELTKSRRLPMIVAIFPLLGNPLDDTYPFFEETRKVAESARSAGAIPLDLFPHYRGLDWTHLVVNGADDEHPNEIGHRIAAQAVAEEIDRLFPKTSERNPKATP